MKKVLILLVISILMIDAAIAQDINKVNMQNYFEVQNFSNEFFKNEKNINVKNKWLKRWLWNHRQDFDANGNLYDYNLEIKNFDYGKNKNNQSLSATSWIPLGPISFPPSYETRSCYSMGRVTCIAFHPKNKNIFWIGTPGGGIWKTENAGKSWIPLIDNMPSLAFSHIAVDPANPNILYAACGDYDISSASSEGIYKSTDGGLSWDKTGLKDNPTFASSLLKKIIINNENTNELIAAGRKGIWKSIDAGKTWVSVYDSTVNDLEINPNDNRVVYAATAQGTSAGSVGVIKSNDFGSTWTALETGIPAKGQISRIDIAVSPADPNYIYALNVKSSRSAFHSLYQSTDAGKTWSMKSALDTTNNILGAWGGDRDDVYGQGTYDLVLLADPYDKNKIYTGGINIWMSENGGTNWSQVSFWIYAFGESIHADHHYADYNVLDGNFYWCNDGGVYRTSSIKPGDQNWVNQWIDRNLEKAKDGAPVYKFPTVWENLSGGLAITEFYRISLMKNKDNVLAGGSQDNSCYYYNNGNWLNYIPNYDGMEAMIDNDNPDVFYGVWQNGGLCRTKDGGKTLQTYLASSTQEYGLWVTPVAMDSKDANTIYIGYRNLWKSTNQGDNWTRVLNFDSTAFTSFNNRQLSIVKTSYNNSDYLCAFKESTYYQDTSKAWVRTPGQLWITKDGSKTWKRSINGLPIDTLDIISIEYDRTNPNIMWAGFYYYYNRNINLYMTTDGGDNWSDVSREMPNGLRLRAIVHQPGDRELIYCGTNKGVYVTENNSKLWLPYNDNLPNCIINDLEINTRTNELYAGTYGRGVWKTNLLINDVKEIKPEDNISIYPNPTESQFNIKMTNQIVGSSANLQILDIRGIEYFSENLTLVNSDFNKEIKPNLESGIYFIKLELNNKKYYSKLIIRK